MEIVSPDSRARDRGEKYYECEQGGVPEYWLVDPQRQQAEFYGRGEDGLYHLIPVDDEGRFHSVVLGGFWLEVVWLWEHPPLPVVLRALGLLG